MKKLLLGFALVTVTLFTYAQEASTKLPERVMFVVDNIPVLKTPEDDQATLSNDDIAELTVVTNKAEMEKLGYKDFDKVLLIITKEYKKRPDELKKIPTTKIMEKKEGLWYLKDANKPYNGSFIDYYYNGKKRGEGTLHDGKIDGLRTVYYTNGNKEFFINYKDGIKEGYSEEYFQNGKIKHKGNYKNDLDDGLWQEFYSDGKIKRQATFKDTRPVFADGEEKFYKLISKGIELMKEEDYKAAIKRFDEAIKLNSNYSDLYFYRGTAKLENLGFDESIVDFGKAVELEPLYTEAIANRAFARLRKYQFKNGRTLSQNNLVTILAVKDKVNIPKDEKSKICADLNNAYLLGDRAAMITDAIKEYCQ